MKNLFVVLNRGLRGVCPQCAGSRLFLRGFSLDVKCRHCQLDFRKDESDIWAILYFTTAFLTGIILIGMLLYKPADSWKGQVTVLVIALLLWLGTYRPRKGFAVAVLYYTDWRWNNHGRYQLR